MLVALFSAKGSPGVTSSALALAATWPRDAVLLEVDPSGSDLLYRCRAATGGSVAPSPNLLGLVSAARSATTAPLSGWAQPLRCGVNVIIGVTSPRQARGMGDLWPALTSAVQSAELDVIIDCGQLRRDDSALGLAAVADVRVPVLAASLDSIMHTREMLKDLPTQARGRTVPLLIGRHRSAVADCSDVDEVLAAAGLIVSPSLALPLDHPGLVAVQDGASSAGRLRASALVRGARSVASELQNTVRSEGAS